MPGQRKKKIKLPGGQEAEGTLVPFQASLENFNEYLLEDGTVIRIKLVLTEAVRIEGLFDDQGTPAYSLKHSQVTSVEAPDELRNGGS